MDIKPGEFGAILELILTDDQNKVVDYRKMKSESFVRQFLDLMFAIQIASSAFYWPAFIACPVRDIDNTLRNVSQSASIFNCTAGSGVTTRGIVVGTSSTAPTISDFKLGSIIAHGTGAGQLQYAAQVYGDPTTDGTISLFRITRPFANGSGGPVTVRELGIYVTDGTHNYMIVRDVPPSAITVPNAQTLTVNYQVLASI